MRIARPIIFIAAVAACGSPVANPMPTAVKAVLAGSAPDAFHQLTDQDQAYFLGALRQCEWRHDPVTTPGPEFVYEIRESSGQSRFVLASGSRFYIGQSYCQLASTSTFRIWKMAERTSS
jgi:hypothetical protein